MGAKYQIIRDCNGVSYDLLRSTNSTDHIKIVNVQCRIFNPESGEEKIIKLGDMQPRAVAWICSYDKNPLLPPGYEISHRDTVEVSSEGFASIHFTMKSLGKDGPLPPAPPCIVKQEGPKFLPGGERLPRRD